MSALDGAPCSTSFLAEIATKSVHIEPNQEISNFTATGKPFKPTKYKTSGLSALGSVDAFGLDMPQCLPFRYTDDSLIFIAVLPPGTPQARPTPAPTSPTSTYSTWSGTTAMSDDNDGPVKHERRPSLKFWKGRKSSDSYGTSPPKKAKKQEFIMKQVTRRDYLKFYAKDDQGRYIGTEPPAKDCILRVEADFLRWRSPTEWKNEIC